MYAGVVAPPLIAGKAVGLSPAELTFLVGASLFTAGLATLLQTIGLWKAGARGAHPAPERSPAASR